MAPQSTPDPAVNLYRMKPGLRCRNRWRCRRPSRKPFQERGTAGLPALAPGSPNTLVGKRARVSCVTVSVEGKLSHETDRVCWKRVSSDARLLASILRLRVRNDRV